MVARIRRIIVVVSILFTCVSGAAAQDALGPGKMELGLFPMAGTFLVGGDDNREVDFNTYTAGGNLTYYVTDRAAVEGEFSIGFGLAQNILFNNSEAFHVQMPNVWSYFGNIVWFPSGARGRHVPYYVTGGIGAVSLQSRLPTKQFGYDIDTVGFETFVAENFGGGVKIFRAAVPNWGFRGDYRYLMVNRNGDAPAFFAKAKSRGGHRVYFGVLFTWKR